MVLGVLGAIGFLRPVPISVRSERKRRLLAGLALAHGNDVSIDRLIDVVWGPDPPRTAHHALQVYVSELRAQLGHGGTGLVTTTNGYRLDSTSIATDVGIVEQLIGAGRVAAVDRRLDDAAAHLEEALTWWRGTPYEGVEDDDVVRAERARLDALLTGLRDELADVYLALGRHVELVPQLQARIVADPWHERGYEQLAVSLYRSGRPADALGALQSARAVLRDELGVDPGPRLAALERAVLNHDVASLLPVTDGLDRDGDAAARPFVGRADEVRRLIATAVDVESSGTARVVLIGGVPGIGKTRLVDELARRLEGWTVLRGRCLDEGGVPGLWPLGEALGPIGDRVIAAASRHHDVLAPLLRLLGEDVLGDPAPEGLARPEAFGLHDATAELLFAVSDRPVVLIVDDAHWADEATLGALVRVAQRVPSGPVLVLLTHRVADVDRSEIFDRTIARLVREPCVSRFDLGPLSADETTEYLRVVSAGLSPADIERIRGVSEGSPLFLGELVDLISSDDVGGRSMLPDSLRHVLEARLDLLGDGADVLSRAAVIGREFDTAILARLGDDTAETISRSLAAGVRAGVIGAVGRSRWAFSHALLAEAAIARLDDDARRRTHLRVATLLEEAPLLEPAIRITETARHRIAALPLGDPVDAATACLRAGDDLLTSFSYEDAAAAFAAAREALGHGCDSALLARTLVCEAESLAAAGAGARAVDLVERAIPLIDRSRDAELFALAIRVLVLHRSPAASLGDERLAGLLQDAIDGLGDGLGWLGIQLRTDLAMLHYRTEAAARSESIAREAMTLADASADPLTCSLAATGLHQAIWRPSTLHERLDLATTAIAAAREVGLTWHESMATVFRAADAWELGEFSRVERDLASATELAARGRRPRFVWIARSWTALLDLYRGDRDAAEAGFAEALAAWGAEPNPDALQCFFAQQLCLRLLDGDTSDIVDVLTEIARSDPDTVLWNALLSYPLALAGRSVDAHRGLDEVLESGIERLRADVIQHVALAMLSEAAALLERPDVAAVVEAVLEPFADRRIVANVYGGGGLCWGSASHALGLCARTQGHDEIASHWFGIALDHHHRDGSAPFVARTRGQLDLLG